MWGEGFVEKTTCGPNYLSMYSYCPPSPPIPSKIFNTFATERLRSATENLHFGLIPQTAERIRTLHMDWGIAMVISSPKHV